METIPNSSQSTVVSQPGGRIFRNWLLPLLLLLAVMVLQWPMLKGSYYKTFGPEIAAGESPDWRTDFSQAQAEALKTQKPMLLDFSASWCPPCQLMKHDVWPDAKVREAVSAGYIPVLLDIDLKANQQLAQRYKVESIPSIIVIDPQGTVLRRTGYRSAANMLEFLQL